MFNRIIRGYNYAWDYKHGDLWMIACALLAIAIIALIILIVSVILWDINATAIRAILVLPTPLLAYYFYLGGKDEPPIN